MLGAPFGAINPYAVTLNPDLWVEDGLFEVESQEGVDEIAAVSVDQVRVTPLAGLARGGSNPCLREQP